MKTLIALVLTILMIISGCVTTTSTSPATPTASLQQEEGKLRGVPETISLKALKPMVVKFDFYEAKRNETGSFSNNFVEKPNGVILDKATNLMWVKGTSSSPLTYLDAGKYVARLNREKYLGHDNWRIPTVEELSSLLSKKKNERGLHISHVFDGKHETCWTSDPCPPEEVFGPDQVHNDFKANHVVNFSKGEIDTATTSRGTDKRFVKAVRTAKKQ